MKTVFSSIVLIICLIHVIEATTTTLKDILARIPQEEQFHQTQFSEAKTIIRTNIANTRTRVNARANGLKLKISSGPRNCNVWYSQVDAIQKQVNLPQEFQLCETGSVLRNVVLSLADIKRSADRAVNLCNLTSFDCQAEIVSLDRDLDVIHASVERDANNMKRTSKDCADARAWEHNRLLDRVEGSWKHCQ